MIHRLIPRTGELLPVIGLGTWQVFDIAAGNPDTHLAGVLRQLHAAGGRLIDSSPMYGRAESTIGELMHGNSQRDDFFYATKVWTTGKEEGILQMKNSLSRMGRITMDLLQIHNMLDWRTQLETLQDWKERGIVRYIGVTHYTDDHHAELERLIAGKAFDFVQFNYSLFNRHAEGRLLGAAAQHGVATIINRPFGEGALLRRLSGSMLPSWAVDYDIADWSAFLLKYTISHPAVTCVIPATANPKHAMDNTQTAKGPLLDRRGRKLMQTWVESFAG